MMFTKLMLFIATLTLDNNTIPLLLCTRQNMSYMSQNIKT